MADELKTDKPRVGIRGNPQSTQVYESKEHLVGAGSTPNYSSALNSLALTPTALGEIGSSIMTNASIALATKWGNELGKEPKGNLIPPVTNFDKQLTNSYLNQSQVTLGNQANSLLLNAQEEMAKYDKLSPAIIKTYHDKMAEGLRDTLDLAPDAIKPQLENQITHQLQSTTHQYNLKLISQNKQQAESAANVWRVHQNDLVTNMVKDAKTPEDLDMARKAFESLQSNINRSNMTPLQKDTAMTTADLNYQSAISIKKLMEARKNGKEDEYLASIADKKIQGLSWSKSEQVRDNTVKYLNAVEIAENRDQTLLISQANLDMAQGNFNESNLASLRDTLRPENYNKVATQWAVAMRKANAQHSINQQVISKPGNAALYSGLSAKQINDAYDGFVSSIVQDGKNKRIDINEDEASFRAASDMNTIVPKFIDGLNRKLSNGNPSQVLSAIEQYERLHELDGNKVLGISDKSLAVADLFKKALASQPADVDMALANARQTVFSKDEETVKKNNSYYREWEHANASTPSKRLSTAIKLSGINSSIPLQNAEAFQADFYSRFRGYMQLTNSDEAVSKERVQKDMSKIWGESKVNGTTQITRLGIEQVIKLPTNSAPLIQADIISQLQPQLDATKELYDKGGSPHYFRLKEGRINYNEYAEAKIAIRDKGFSDPEYASHKKLISKFEKGLPIEIEQVTKKGNYTWHLNVQTSPYAQMSSSGQVSGFNLNIRNPETGEQGQLYGYYGPTHSIPTYTPNEQFISENYIGLNNINVSNPRDRAKRFVLQNEILNKSLSELAQYSQKIIQEQNAKRAPK